MTPAAPTIDADYFERIYATGDDPWGYRSRWYEERKRNLMAACLPDRRYGHAFEPGCAGGELAEVLSQRCDRYLAADRDPTAVASARRHLQSLSHVEVRLLCLPQDWPVDERFDLVVLSEWGYYIGAAELAAVAAQARRSLKVGGVVLGCHWRHPIPGCERAGDEVQALLHEGLGLARLARHEEPDFSLAVWSSDARSLASREGFV